MPFDYGPLFLHGSHPDFLAAQKLAEGRVDGWPRRIEGRGTPCQPDAFAPFETRTAYAGGLTAFPKALADGLEIRLHTLVRGLRAGSGGITAETESGETLAARDMVVAFALEQSAALLGTLGPQGQSGASLLGLFASLPCLAIVAAYSADSPAPSWDILYPEDDSAILLVGNESSKRTQGGPLTLTCQALPLWSRRRLETPKESWSGELLAAMAARLGSWAGSPLWVHPHRWRYARLDRANELAAPLVIPISGSRLGLAGDLFTPGGGAQAAWLSGDRLGMKLAGT
jgi:renalase